MNWNSPTWKERTFAVLALLLVASLYVPSSTAQAQVEDGTQLCSPTGSDESASQAQAGQDGGGRTIQGALAYQPGESLTVFSGAPNEVVIVVVDAMVRIDSLGAFSPEGKFVIVCVDIQPTGTSSKSIPLSAFHIGEGDTEDSKPLAKDVTALINFDVLGLSNAGDIYGDIMRPVVDFPSGRATRVALVFDVSNEWRDLYLTHGGWEDGDAKTKQFVVLLDSLIGVDATPTTESTNSEPATSETSHGVVTQFGQTEIVTVNLNKWKLTFDPNVEVRYFIGDQSITPRRGQFLVLWFDQETNNNEPFLLGNFQLRASEGVGEQFTTYDLAQEGTAALILTEYDWDPQFMENGLPYRTGIVFDIRPEDTHFELIYMVPSNPIGPTNIVHIVFDA